MAQNHIPDEVIKYCNETKKTLTVEGNPHPFKEIAEILTNPDREELGLMWRTLINHKVERSDEKPAPDMWDFLRAVDHAYKLPHFNSLSKKDRTKLADKIKDTATDLAKSLEKAGLDGVLIHRNSDNFGRAPYEGMAFFVSDSEKDLYSGPYLTDIVRQIGDEASSRINEPRVTGKAVQRVKANQFVRLLASYMQEAYDRPLHRVVSCAVKVLYDEEYSPNDIRKLVRDSK